MGYASFADERFAAMARDAYHMWQGFGNSGLVVEIMMEQRSQPGPMGAAVDNFRSSAVKRPPQDMIGAFHHEAYIQSFQLCGLLRGSFELCRQKSSFGMELAIPATGY